MKLINLKNKKFGDLIVLYRVETDRNGKTKWLCQCNCGRKKSISADHLTRKSNPVKTCGCSLKKKGKKHPNFNGYEEISGAWWTTRVNKGTSSRRYIPVRITKKYAWKLFIKQKRKCALTGIFLEINNNASIDRIDSSKGYQKNNIQWVHKDINMMKRVYDQDYFIKMCKKVAENNK